MHERPHPHTRPLRLTNRHPTPLLQIPLRHSAPPAHSRKRPNMPIQFADEITTEDHLREILGHPAERAANKAVTTIDEHCSAVIERSPFMLIGSADADGNIDISPKGDHLASSKSSTKKLSPSRTAKVIAAPTPSPTYWQTRK